ncbi:hypothetical protein ACER0A_005360 [Haloimpatiens sp. FM7315]|uniref:hypothetical protein n=1 Tax=Haloimpatiens sp. FM7315 TaxID=3298609 RepID=UPI003709E32A
MSYNNVENFLKNCSKPQNYNFEFECDNGEYINLPSINRYFTYKATAPAMIDSAYITGKKFAEDIQNSGKYNQLGDCDGSGNTGNISLIHDVYFKLWGWKKDSSTFENNQDSGFRCQFGGDTMNSVQYILNDVVKEIINRQENKNLFDKKIGHFSINYLLGLYGDLECRKQLIKALNSVEYLSQYFNGYHTIGNFVLVPSYFNRWRGINGKVQDYWDFSLKHLKEEGWKDDFNNKGNNIKDYYRYINYFFLWGYVDDQGNCIELLKRNNDSIKNKEHFLEKVVKLIKNRSCFMIAMLRLQQKLGIKAYVKLREKVFLKDDGVYKNFDEVFEVLKELLGEDIINEIWNR